MAPQAQPGDHTGSPLPHGGLAEIIRTRRPPGAMCWDSDHAYPHDDDTPRRYRTRADRRRFLREHGSEEV